MLKPAIYVYSRMLADVQLRPLRPKLRRKLALTKMNHAFHLIVNGRASEARSLLWMPLTGGALVHALVALAVSIVSTSLAASTLKRLRNAHRSRPTLA
jgi:hypothetical protein